MPVKSLSFGFQMLMWLLGGIFWVLGWIPGLNLVTNVIYWLIWLGVFFYKYLPLIKAIAKAGVTLGALGTKIALVNSLAFILGEIPLVSILPWNLVANWLTNREINQLVQQAKPLAEGVQSARAAWSKRGVGRS